MSVIQLSQPKKLSKLFTLALPLALSIASMGLITRPAFSQEATMNRVLTVTGQGTESTPASLAQIQLGVEVQGETAAEVQQEIANRSAAVIEYLQSQNVQKLQTTGVYLYPQYDYSENGNQRIIGYTASNTVSFRVDTTRAGAIMDSAVDAGATRIDGVSFVADDNAIATAQREALREATEEALAQADVVLESLGLSRDEVVGIQINNSSTYLPPIPYAAVAEDRAASTPVIAGEQDVSATVTLEISY